MFPIVRTHLSDMVVFQSLAHMKVPQRHCVPFSFCPEGPNGLGHMVRTFDTGRVTMTQMGSLLTVNISRIVVHS